MSAKLELVRARLARWLEDTRDDGIVEGAAKVDPVSEKRPVGAGRDPAQYW
ncbi:MAG TPA: hypothetical protein VEL28_04720 [Candidatus Binatia bacterium]|nr:hypothetical protein [Candidatus Binatia bacterium]